MRSVLISIRPKWCELIANGKKTVEVRKTRPKLETPFKVYIYCTLPPKEELFTHGCIREYAHELIRLQSGEIVYDYGMRLCVDPEDRPYSRDNFLCKKVIGEFVCDETREIGFSPYYHGEYTCEERTYIEQTRLTFDEMFEYLGEGYGYGWHISDLVIYDTPKSLSEFRGLRKTKFGYEPVSLTRPPQSWCYVEEVSQP